MKRMSEVFDLPVSTLDIGCCVHTIDEAEEYATHAINHVDALADALDSIIGEHGAIVLARESVIDNAIATLKAYRGEK